MLMILFIWIYLEFNFWTWIDISTLTVEFKTLLDPLSISFALLISFIRA